MLAADGCDDVRSDVDAEVARVAPVYRAREAPIPTTSIDDRFDAVLLHEVFDVGAIFPRDLQSRSRAADSLACDVLAPHSFRIDAIEGVGQPSLVDRIDREVAQHQRRGQARGNGDAFLHQVGLGIQLRNALCESYSAGVRTRGLAPTCSYQKPS